MKTGLHGLLGLLLILASWARAEETLQVVTEEYPPYNYTDHGHLTGLATDIVQAVLRTAGMKASIRSLPWARAYEMAQSEDTVMIYSITRIPQREKLFKWAGPIAPNRRYLFAWHERPVHLNTLDEAKRYRTGTVYDDAGEIYLMAHGFTKGKELQSSSYYRLSYQLLKLGRVDLWLIDELVADYIARQAGDDPKRVLVKAYQPDNFGSGFYIAFSLHTPDATVERMQKALDALRQNGQLEAISRKWVPDAPSH